MKFMAEMKPAWLKNLWCHSSVLQRQCLHLYQSLTAT